MGWASVADVLEATGATVSEAQLAQAAATIEIHTGRPYDEDTAARTGSRDTHWLKRAECYQAVWQLAQPDLFERSNVTQVAQEGGGTTGLTPDALTLAPLAKRAVEQLSWRRSRSLHTPSPRRAGVDVDDCGDWRPL